MTIEIRKDLNRARGLYKAKKYQEAYEIYEGHFSQAPNRFDYWDTVRYCWCMYYLFIKDASDETELFEYTQIVTETIGQLDLNQAPVCVYTRCVSKVVMFLKSRHDWEYVIYWLDKLDPKLLSEEKEPKDSRFPSKKENYYRLLSTAYDKCGYYEECIETSREALDVLTDFSFDGDVWHKWRIGKALNRLGRPKEALEYLGDVVNVYEDWYILKEIADCCYKLGDEVDAIYNAYRALSSDVEPNLKVNLYLLLYRIFKDSDPEKALKCAQLYYALKCEYGGEVDEEIENLNIDASNLDIASLESDVRNHR